MQVCSQRGTFCRPKRYLPTLAGCPMRGTSCGQRGTSCYRKAVCTGFVRAVPREVFVVGRGVFFYGQKRYVPTLCRLSSERYL